MKRPYIHLSKKAFTLVEVLLSMAIVSFTGIAILSALSFGIQMKQAVRERNGAMRVAANLLEENKRIYFPYLESRTLTDVVIDDRGTKSATDDVKGTVDITFYDLNGVKVATPTSPVPMDKSMIRAEVVIRWKPAGRRSPNVQAVTLQSLLSP